MRRGGAGGRAPNARSGDRRRDAASYSLSSMGDAEIFTGKSIAGGLAIFF
jgi:hypothetical protein